MTSLGPFQPKAFYDSVEFTQVFWNQGEHLIRITLGCSARLLIALSLFLISIFMKLLKIKILLEITSQKTQKDF